MPDFVVLGAAKAGTTSLAAALAEHPGVFLPDCPEPGWLAWDGGAPRRWPADVPADVPIRSQAAYEALFEAAPPQAVAGDISPLYLESVHAPRRLAEELPGALLVATLRDPADRAWSSYWMHRQAGLESRAPEEAFGPDEHRVQVGHYARNLQPFGEGVLLLVFERWTVDPAHLGPLLDALGLDPAGFPPEAPAANRGGVPTNRLAAGLLASPGARALASRLPAPAADLGRAVKARLLRPPPPMPPAIRAHLDALYRDGVHALAPRLGGVPAGWLRSQEAGS